MPRGNKSTDRGNLAASRREGIDAEDDGDIGAAAHVVDRDSRAHNRSDERGGANALCDVLEPVGPGTEPGELVAQPVSMGCYGTYAEALLVGSEGNTKLPANIGPADLTQSILDQATADTTLASYLLGTESVDTGYGGTSNSYYAGGDCLGDTWAVSWVGDAWNDRFESGRGFSNCDHNKKFENADFGGAVLTCTPNCNTYGALNNEISSLRWKD